MAVEWLDQTEVDLRFLEMFLNEHDGGVVEFTVKELLEGIRTDLVDLGKDVRERPTRAEFTDLRNEMHDIRVKVDAGELRWARLLGGGAAVASIGGFIGAGVLRLLGG